MSPRTLAACVLSCMPGTEPRDWEQTPPPNVEQPVAKKPTPAAAPSLKSPKQPGVKRGPRGPYKPRKPKQQMVATQQQPLVMVQPLQQWATVHECAPPAVAPVLKSSAAFWNPQPFTSEAAHSSPSSPLSAAQSSSPPPLPQPFSMSYMPPPPVAIFQLHAPFGSSAPPHALVAPPMNKVSLMSSFLPTL